jgi:transposase-like protein
MAVRAAKARLETALRDVGYSRAVHVRLRLDSVPGVETVAVYAWPEPLGAPKRVGVDIVAVNDKTLSKPKRLWLDVAHGEAVPREAIPVVVLPRDVIDPRPTEVRMEYVVWVLVDGVGKQPEVRKLTCDGQPEVDLVDTSVYSYRMTCPRCGRARYAKRNSIHQIRYCRPCTQADQKRRKAVSQYQKRTKRTLTGVPKSARERVRELADGRSIRAIAREVGLSGATVCRILKN